VVRQLQAPEVKLRTVDESDRELIWHWANQPSVRKASFLSERIDWERHVEWFSQMMKGVATRMYIGMVDDVPIGLIRYTLQGTVAEVSVSVHEREQGKGIGPVLIAAGNKRIMVDEQIELIRAFIKRDNQVSLNAFLAAGYEVSAEVVRHDQEAWLLERNLGSALAGTTTSASIPVQGDRASND
jgi:RimJ/RimL family protein N-acetyltransferase